MKITFLDHVKKTYGAEAGRRCQAVLRSMNLSDPVNHTDGSRFDEFLIGTEASLVCLNEYGLALRISWVDKNLCASSDHILQPIGASDFFQGREREHTHDNLVSIELLPAIEAVARNENEPNILRTKLLKSNMDFWDNSVANIGYLNYRTEEYPEGFPVVLDRGAIKIIQDLSVRPSPEPEKGFFERLAEFFGVHSEETSVREEKAPSPPDISAFPVHEKLFGTFARSLRSAWPEGFSSGSYEPGLMQGFLDRCRNERARGKDSVLQTAWCRVHDYDSIHWKPFKAEQVAANYQSAVREYRASRRPA